MSHQGNVIQTIMRYNFILIALAGIKKIIADWNTHTLLVRILKWCNHFGKQVWQFLKTLSIELSDDPAISLLGASERK